MKKYVKADTDTEEITYINSLYNQFFGIKRDSLDLMQCNDTINYYIDKYNITFSDNEELNDYVNTCLDDINDIYTKLEKIWNDANNILTEFDKQL